MSVGIRAVGILVFVLRLALSIFHRWIIAARGGKLKKKGHKIGQNRTNACISREILSRIYAGARNGMCVLRAPRIQPLSEIWNSQMESELRDDERWDLQIPRHPAGHQSQTTSNNLKQPQTISNNLCPPSSPVRYVLKIHFFIEFGLKMIQFKIQFKTKSKIFIKKIQKRVQNIQ